MHKHLQNLHDTETSALNQTPHTIDAIPNLTARGASSLPYPIKDLPPSVKQLLQEGEAKWHQRFEDQARKYQDNLRFLSLECQKKLNQYSDEGFERCEKKNQELMEQSVEIASLIVESTPPIFLLFLTDI